MAKPIRKTTVALCGEANGRCIYPDLMIRVIRRLRPHARRHPGNMTYKEISDIFDIPFTSIRSILHERLDTAIIITKTTDEL